MDASGGPIHSHVEGDRSHADAIEAFVVALAERVDALQDNEAGGDWPRLLAGAEELARAARQAGYPQLGESAAGVPGAAAQGHAELARKALVGLTGVARRIRRAHRGSL